MQIINGVQCRTGKESLEHIIKQAKKGKIGPSAEKNDSIGSCNYRYASGNNCAVGSLFSKAQLRDIQARGGNAYSIAYVANGGSGGIGVSWKNIEAVTGLKKPQLEALQSIHDTATMQSRNPKIIEACEQALKTGKLADIAITQ